MHFGQCKPCCKLTETTSQGRRGWSCFPRRKTEGEKDPGASLLSNIRAGMRKVQVEEEESDPRELGSAPCLKLKGNSLPRHPINHGAATVELKWWWVGFCGEEPEIAPYFLLACVWHVEDTEVPRDILPRWLRRPACELITAS